MIEIALVIYATIYVLWLLAFLVCGEVSRFFSVTMFFVLLPLLLVMTLALLVTMLVVSPFVLFFSKEARSEFIRKVEEN